MNVVWVILIVIALLIVYLAVKFLTGGGTYGVTARNVCDWYIGFKKYMMNHDEKEISTLLELTTVGSQNAYLLKGKIPLVTFRLAAREAYRKSHIKAENISNLDFDEEIEMLVVLCKHIMFEVFSHDLNVPTLTIYSNIEKKDEMIRKSVRKKLEKSLNNENSAFIMGFVKRNPECFSRLYRDFE